MKTRKAGDSGLRRARLPIAGSTLGTNTSGGYGGDGRDGYDGRQRGQRGHPGAREAKAAQVSGGGIYDADSTITLTNSIVDGTNVADGGLGGTGGVGGAGGIGISGSQGNFTGFAGGVGGLGGQGGRGGDGAGGGLYVNGGTLSLADALISGNEHHGGAGG